MLAGADLVSEILTAAPRVKILVTSREGLNLAEEWLQPVRGMRFPDADTADETPLEAYSAAQLFVQRAQRVAPGFSLTQERANVARVCQLVEGDALGP